MGSKVDDRGEPYHPEGSVIGLIITIGETTFYYPSDTDALPQHESVIADVVLPPIGGQYTMGPAEAAELMLEIDPDLVLPVHYNTFDDSPIDVEEFIEELETNGIWVELF